MFKIGYLIVHIVVTVLRVNSIINMIALRNRYRNLGDGARNGKEVSHWISWGGTYNFIIITLTKFMFYPFDPSLDLPLATAVHSFVSFNHNIAHILCYLFIQYVSSYSPTNKNILIDHC